MPIPCPFQGVALVGHLLASKIWVIAGCRVPGLTNKYQFFVLFCWKTPDIVSMLPKSPKIGSSSTDLPGDLNVDSQRNRVECEAKVGKLLLKVFIYNRTLESSKHCCCEITCKYQDVCFRVASMYGFNSSQWILMWCVDMLVVLLINLLFLSKINRCNSLMVQSLNNMTGSSQ